MIAPVRCRWLRLHGEAARLLGRQKSQRFCRIAKSTTCFDPASIAFGGSQPLMSAPASVPRVARPSEATSFARSGHPSPVPHTSLMSSSSYCALFPQLRPRHSSRYYRLNVVPYSHSCELSTCQDTTASAVCPFGSQCRVFLSGPMEGVLPGICAGSPSGGRCHRSS